MNLKDLWLATLRELNGEIQHANLITWFKNTAILGVEDGVMTVGLPLQIFLDWHKKNYAEPTLKAVQKQMSAVRALAYEVDTTLSEKDTRVIDLMNHFPEKETRKLPRKAEVKINGEVVSKALNPSYTLDNFVVSPQNRLAHAASATVAKFPGQQNYNPLFVHGGVGLGKTHLIQATGREVLKNDPSKVVVYVSAEAFANDYIEAVRSKNYDRLRNKYRKVDVMIIDDIQFIASKERTEEEFFHTFNALTESGKQVIISSDRPPHELSLFSERLVSRFTSGMVVDVKMPEYETRLAILRNKCQQAQVFMNDQILDLIASNVDTSVRALIGVLNQVIARYELEHTAPTVRSVSEILQHIKKELRMPGPIPEEPTTHRAVTLEHLIECASQYYSLPRESVVGESRAREFLGPRQVIMYLAKTRLHMPLAKIGQMLGNRNHTTVLNAIGKMQSMLQENRQLLCDVNAIAQEAGIR
jgi:chromosomal replication initiator protein